MRTAAAITGAIILGVFAGRAMGAEVPVSSRIETVTVFPSGAETTRAARLSLEKGEHTLLISDLPAEVVPGSIRVDGKATAGLEIQSVDTRRRYIPRADQEALHAERKSIEDEIEKLRDERGLTQGQEDAAQTQKMLLQNLAQMPGRPQAEEGQPTPGAQALPRTDWQQILSLIGTGMVDAQRSALDAEVKKRDLDRRIEELEKKLAALAPGRVEQTEVKVFVVAAAPLEADLTVRYQVPSASWTPHYDARLATGSKTAPPALELARRADIVQRTGETWENVALLLSTTRPTANASAPTIETVAVDFAPEPRPAASVSAPMAPAPYADNDGLSERKSKRLALGRSGGGEASAEAAPVLEIAQQAATAEVAPFQAVFGVPGKLSVPATGETKRVFLQQDQIEPVLTVRTVPKLDAKAYLYAKLVLPKGSPVLPGAVSLFRDGTFVGSGALPALSPGEDYELGFGADDQMRVRHTIADEKRGETGLISSAKTDSRNFRITVKNMHERAVELVVQDQIPVSQNDDIKVEYVGPTPSKKDVDGKRGVITFESKLGPEEERQIEFGYRVIWPGARTIIYR